LPNCHSIPKDLLHRTLTESASQEQGVIAVVYGSPSEKSAITGKPELRSRAEWILKKYYREETLSSALARSTFLLPDKAVAEA
jgi:hypothetical protein